MNKSHLNRWPITPATFVQYLYIIPTNLYCMYVRIYYIILGYSQNYNLYQYKCTYLYYHNYVILYHMSYYNILLYIIIIHMYGVCVYNIRMCGPICQGYVRTQYRFSQRKGAMSSLPRVATWCNKIIKLLLRMTFGVCHTLEKI